MADLPSTERPHHWLIFEGVAYERSADFPGAPPWTHVDRAAKADPALTHAATAYWAGKVAELQAEVERLRKLVEPKEWLGWDQVDSIYDEARLLRRERDEARDQLKGAVETFGRLEHLLSSPGDMSRDEIRAEGRRLIAETRGATDEKEETGA